MTTWHRTTDSGTPVLFSYEADARRNVTLTVEEVEGLMRTGGWELEQPSRPEPTLDELVANMNRLLTGWGYAIPKETP